MYDRLRSLYADVGRSDSADLFPSALKDLGLAAEELQVATEELHQQNDHMNTSLDSALQQCQYYQDLFYYASEAQMVTTAEGKIVEANLAAAQLLNVPCPLLASKFLVSFVPLHERIPFRSELNRLQQSHQTKTWVTCLQPHHSQPIDLTLTVAPVRNDIKGEVALHWTLRAAATSWATPDGSNGNGSKPAVQVEQSRPDAWQGALPDGTIALDDRPLQTYVKGEVIPLNSQTVWLVCDGLVKLSTLTENSEEIVLGLVGATMPLSAGSIVLPVYQAIALSDVRLVRFSIAEINTSLTLAQMLLPKFHQRIQQMELLLNIAGQRRVSDRLYHLLRLLKREVGQPVREGTQLAVRLTHEDIANACCSTRVTMTRLLGDLQRQGKLTIDKRSHIILHEGF